MITVHLEHRFVIWASGTMATDGCWCRASWTSPHTPWSAPPSVVWSKTLTSVSSSSAWSESLNMLCTVLVNYHWTAHLILYKYSQQQILRAGHQKQTNINWWSTIPDSESQHFKDFLTSRLYPDSCGLQLFPLLWICQVHFFESILILV